MKEMIYRCYFGGLTDEGSLFSCDKFLGIRQCRVRQYMIFS